MLVRFTCNQHVFIRGIWPCRCSFKGPERSNLARQDQDSNKGHAATPQTPKQIFLEHRQCGQQCADMQCHPRVLCSSTIMHIHIPLLTLPVLKIFVSGVAACPPQNPHLVPPNWIPLVPRKKTYKDEHHWWRCGDRAVFLACRSTKKTFLLTEYEMLLAECKVHCVFY